MPMKLLRYGPHGHERPGLRLEEGTIRDLGGIVSATAGETLSAAGLFASGARDARSLPIMDEAPRLDPCIGALESQRTLEARP